MSCASCKYGYTPPDWEPMIFCGHPERNKPGGCPLRRGGRGEGGLARGAEKERERGRGSPGAP